jgi:hypothetical protein
MEERRAAVGAEPEPLRNVSRNESATKGGPLQNVEAAERGQGVRRSRYSRGSWQAVDGCRCHVQGGEVPGEERGLPPSLDVESQPPACHRAVEFGFERLVEPVQTSEQGCVAIRGTESADYVDPALNREVVGSGVPSQVSQLLLDLLRWQRDDCQFAPGAGVMTQPASVPPRRSRSRR